MINVVHLLQHWGDETPPDDLRIRGRMTVAARILLAVVLVAAALVCGIFVVVLWTNETPGWWFSLLFTVILVGLPVALWGAYLAALRSGNERQAALELWRESLPEVTPTAGTIVSRDVSTLEDGSVNTFELTVSTSADTRLSGMWTPRSSASRGLLQSQVPGVGAAVRVWRSPESPAVIEVLDPTVVPGDGTLPKYAA